MFSWLKATSPSYLKELCPSSSRELPEPFRLVLSVLLEAHLDPPLLSFRAFRRLFFDRLLKTHPFDAF